MFRLLLSFLFKPYVVVIIPVFISFIFWEIPTEWGFYKGFDIKEQFSVEALILLLSWYCLVMLSIYSGFKIGKRIPVPQIIDKKVSIDKNNIYYIYTVIGLIGFASFIKESLTSLSLEGVLFMIINFSVNEIQKAGYENYQIGLLSLRYVLLISFGIAIFRIYSKKSSNIDYLNIIIYMLYIMLLGRRLQLICGLVVFLCLANRNENLVQKIKLKKLVFYGILFYSLILIPSILRGFNGYINRGIENPLLVGIANAIEYMAPTIQVSVGIANNIGMAINGIDYRSYINVSEDLTTNSALSYIIIDYGYLGYLYYSLSLFIYSIIAGFLSNNKGNYLFIGYPIIYYGFTEIWRINFYIEGIFVTLIMVGVGLPIVFFLFKIIRFK